MQRVAQTYACIESLSDDIRECVVERDLYVDLSPFYSPVYGFVSDGRLEKQPADPLRILNAQDVAVVAHLTIYVLVRRLGAASSRSSKQSMKARSAGCG